MNIALLGAPDSWYVNDLARAAGSRHRVERVPFSRVHSHVGVKKAPDVFCTVGSAEYDLAEFDAVLVRTMPPGSLEQVVFRMDALAQLEASGVHVLNPPRALEAAIDKYLCLAKLAQAGLPVPPTFACQSYEEAMAGFADLGGDCVLKPLFGSEGRGITRLTDEALAHRAFKMLEQMKAVIYLQPFIPHEGYDIRVLTLGEQMWCIRRRHDSDWRTNVSLGAIAESHELTPQLADLARAAADAIGAPFAGVDILPAKDGRLYLLEVNAVPGWRALAKTLKVDIAGEVMKRLEA